MSELVPVRFSHLLGFAGIGSIVRSERYLYTIKDTRDWPVTYPIPYLERVRCALVLHQQLHEPPKGVDGNPQTLLPGMRFPSWMRCNTCGLMHWRPWNQPHDTTIGPCCTHCDGGRKVPLAQYPWVVIDNFGRMDDVPWHWLLHHGGNCRHDWQKQTIKLNENNTGQRWKLSCLVCKRMIDQGDNINQHAGLKVFRHQPWLNDNDAAPQVPEGIVPEVRLVDISSPGLYSVPICSALVIPPESRIERGSVIDLLYRDGPAKTDLFNARTPKAREQQFNKLHTKFKRDVSEVKLAWEKINQIDGYPLYGCLLYTSPSPRDS